MQEEVLEYLAVVVAAAAATAATAAAVVVAAAAAATAAVVAAAAAAAAAVACETDENGFGTSWFELAFERRVQGGRRWTAFCRKIR